MTNRCSVKQAEFLHFPESLWWLRVGSLLHKTNVKGRDPEASFGCTGFVLIFKGCAAFSQDQNPQTNKPQIHTSKMLNSPATSLHGGALIHTRALIASCCWWCFNMTCCGCVIVRAYLTGAPLLWAGFSSTVTVVSVWFREVSWSYAGMEGAKEKQWAQTGFLQHRRATFSSAQHQDFYIFHSLIDI